MWRPVTWVDFYIGLNLFVDKVGGVAVAFFRSTDLLHRSSEALRSPICIEALKLVQRP
jgi:hypothetical protein